MKAYRVEITRVVKQTHDIEVEAENEEEALERAEEEAGNLGNDDDWTDEQTVEEPEVNDNSITELTDEEEEDEEEDEEEGADV